MLISETQAIVDNVVNLYQDYDQVDVEMKYPGGRCYCKAPGLKDNIVSWDFKGYYSSLMRTFNIGPDTLMLTKDLREVPMKKRPYIPLVKSPYTHLNEEVLDKLNETLLDEGRDINFIKPEIEGYNIKIQTPAITTILHKSKVKAYYIDVQKHIDKMWKTYQGKLTIKRESFHGFLFKLHKTRVNKDGNVKVSIGMPNQCYFRQDFDSIIRIALDKADKERSLWKAVLKDLENRNLEHTVEYMRANSEQLVYKLLGNVMYGQMGNIYSRIYHAACAMSITLAGQYATEWTRGYFEKNGMFVWYMDTDSNYVYDPLYSKERESRFVVHFNGSYHQNLYGYCQKMFGVKPEDNCIILEREKTWERMIFLSKKRYAGIVVESDGKACRKFVTRGIELRRTGTIKFAKDFQEKYYEMVFRQPIPSVEEFKDLVETAHSSFYDLEFNNRENVEQITKRQKLTKAIHDYKTQTCQVQLMKRCVEAGDELEIGSMLEYVLLKITDKQTKNYAETVDRYIEAPAGTMKVHRDQYWNKEIYSPMFKQLVRLFPNENWGEYDSTHKAMCDKKYKATVKRLVKKKLVDQIKTVKLILGYKRYCKEQYIDLLEQCQSKYRTVESEELHKLIDDGLEYYRNDRFLEVLTKEDKDVEDADDKLV